MAPRYDFYQNDSKVVVEIFLKNAQESNYNLKISEQEIKLTADPDVNLSISLFSPIDCGSSTHKVKSTKIEVTLYKKDGIRWPALEQGAMKVMNNTYQATKNWSAIVKEGEEYEKQEMNLYQLMGEHASAEAKRAMMKSLTESNGTVMSDDWSKVRSETIKPFENSSSDTEDSDDDDSDKDN